MKTISREELKARMDRNEPVQLVMALGRWNYERLHIPGSVTVEEMVERHALATGQEVVVYCSNEACPASYRTYYLLKSLGYDHVRRFAGGIEEWMEAGYPVEGTLAENQPA